MTSIFKKDNDSYQATSQSQVELKQLLQPLITPTDMSSVDDSKYDIERAFEEMGGFGRFQWLVSIFLTITRNCGNWMYYGFAYLTMEQMYVCQFEEDGPYVSCSAEEDICSASDSGQELLGYKVDTDYDYYFNNWFVDMDLVCVSTFKVNFIISAKYIVYGVVGLLFFAMPDKYGRKFTMILWLTVHVPAQLLLLFYSSYWARFTGLVLYGLA